MHKNFPIRLFWLRDRAKSVPLSRIHNWQRCCESTVLRIKTYGMHRTQFWCPAPFCHRTSPKPVQETHQKRETEVDSPITMAKDFFKGRTRGSGLYAWVGKRYKKIIWNICMEMILPVQTLAKKIIICIFDPTYSITNRWSSIIVTAYNLVHSYHHFQMQNIDFKKQKISLRLQK